MLIKVLGTTSSEAVFGKKKQKYPVVDVNYERDGKAEKKTLRGFSYPEVVKFFSDLNDFPVVIEVTSEKNDKGYWDWTRAMKADGTTAEKVAAEAPAGKKNVFEERDLKIVKQSSLQRAMEMVLHNNSVEPGKPKAVDPADVTAVAEIFVQWVLAPYSNSDDDIPF